jgi:hypothetical protein
MSEALIREIAERIVNEQLLLNWRFYLALLGVAIISSAVVAYAGAYLRKRGEAYATKADFAELLKQLKATTTAAEEAKTLISHADWSSREWKTIRRVKLEEILSSVYALENWVIQKLTHLMDNKLVISSLYEAPLSQLRQLCALYFPELQPEVQAISICIKDYANRLTDLQLSIEKARENRETQLQLIREFSAEVKQTLNAALQEAIGKLEKRTSMLMQELSSGK